MIRSRVVLVTDPRTGNQLRFLALDTIRDIASCIRHARDLFAIRRTRDLKIQLGESRHA